ncbi:protoporphyrinogen/coproporphyrinogen oxidase [Streptomyces sp. NBC_00203]|uniref:protoporphyrinogen/coproporphyrinogen oxidase n=1 Tax=Streptomyces sp. NBC_00203 TaxID=2975680 RepID=UPI00324DE27B
MNSERDVADVIVVGGGWSGIATAWRLHRHGLRPVLIDDRPTLGGRSAQTSLGSRTVTLGGKNIGRKYTHFREFAAELGLGASDFEHFGINSSRIEDSRLRTVDSTGRAASVYGLLRGIPPRDLARILRLAWYTRRERANAFCSGPDFDRLAARTGDPSLAEYFGTTLRQRLVRPAVVRMNGAEPDETHLGNFGTNLGMLLDSFDQLTHGFTPLLDGFRGQIATHTATRVTGLTVDSGRVTGVRATTEAGEQLTLTADAVVLAVPAPAAAALTAEHQPALAEQLGAVRYFPVAVVIAEYDRPVFDERVRALTFPPDCPLSNAGAYGVTDRHIVRYTFSGRAARSLPPGNDDLITLAEKELGAHLDLTTPRRTGAVTARWEHGLCAYSPFHSSTLTKINTLSKELAGLTLTGDYVRGASIEACFRAAYERTDAVIRTLTPRIP